MPCLALDSNGNTAIPFRMVFGVDVVRVRILTRLNTVLGEWLSDTRKGLPWLRWTGQAGHGAGPTDSEAASTVRRQLAGITGVVEVQSASASRSGFALAISATVLAREDGEERVLALGGTFDPFDTSPASPWYVIDAPTGLL